MSDDDSYPTEWVSQAPSADWDHDPAKTAAINARLVELCLMHASADPRWIRTTLALAADLTDNDQVVEMLSPGRLVDRWHRRNAGDAGPLRRA